MNISPIIKKAIMALTGLFLCTFLVEHLIGNMMLLKGDGGASFNDYAKFMGENPIIRIMEVVLVAGFLFHIVDGIMITRANKMARKKGYAFPNKSKTSWAAKNMSLLGILILVFLVFHLFKFAIPYKLHYMQNATLFDEVKASFENPVYSVIYVISMVILAFHLDHGFQSAFKTLGINHPKYSPVISYVGSFFAFVVPALFALIPVYFLYHSL